MRIGRGREFSRTRILAESGIDKLDMELARARHFLQLVRSPGYSDWCQRGDDVVHADLRQTQSPGRQEQDSGDDNRDESHEGDGGDDEDLQRVFSKAAKEGDPAGVRDQLLPIQSFMRKHALGPEQLEDDVREAYLDALCMK